MGIIYKITNTVNGKVYIGQTTRSLSTRWCLHKSPRSYCRHLFNAIKKHGSDRFIIEQIDQADTIEELNRKEREYIAFYNSTDRLKGYNLMSGGGNSHHSEETKLKLRKTTSRMWQDPEQRARIVERMREKKSDVLCRERYKNSLLERWKLKEYRSKIIETMKSNEYRQKQSETHKQLHADKDFHDRWCKASKECHGVKIECIETGQIFGSITDAAITIKRSDTSIRKVLAGVRNTAGGFHWKYAVDREVQ